jgi:hypothetical protein
MSGIVPSLRCLAFEALFQRNSKGRPFAGRVFVLIGVLIGGRKVSWRRSSLKAVAPVPICEQQIGEMRVQQWRSPRRRAEKENQA